MRVVFSILLLLLAFSCRDSAQSKRFPIPLNFFQTLWKKIRNQPELVCTINGRRVDAEEKRAELKELDDQKAALLKVIRKLHTDMEKVKKITRTWCNSGQDIVTQSLIAWLLPICLSLLLCGS